VTCHSIDRTIYKYPHGHAGKRVIRGKRDKEVEKVTKAKEKLQELEQKMLSGHR